MAELPVCRAHLRRAGTLQAATGRPAFQG